MHLLRVIVVASLSLTACAEPAELGEDEAAVTGLGWQLVTGQTALSTAGSQQLRVACPTGKVVYGAGWAALDPTNAILSGEAVRFEPAANGRSWSATVRNHSAFAPSWSLKLWVMCARPTATYRIDRLSSVAPVDRLELSCSWGVPSAGGYVGLDVDGKPADLELSASEPWSVEGWYLETSGKTGATLSVICHDPFALVDYTQVPVTVIAGSGGGQVTPACPAGQVTIGAGWRVSELSGKPAPGHVRTFQPSWNGTSWLVQSDHGAAQYELGATALCVTP